MTLRASRSQRGGDLGVTQGTRGVTQMADDFQSCRAVLPPGIERAAPRASAGFSGVFWDESLGKFIKRANAAGRLLNYTWTNHSKCSSA
jgi:hypothetical protein